MSCSLANTKGHSLGEGELSGHLNIRNMVADLTAAVSVLTVCLVRILKGVYVPRPEHLAALEATPSSTWRMLRLWRSRSVACGG